MEPKTIYEIPYEYVTFRLVCHDHKNVELWQLCDDEVIAGPIDVKSVTKLDDDYLVKFHSGEYTVI